jgi:hypothetical protein
VRPHVVVGARYSRSMRSARSIRAWRSSSWARCSRTFTSSFLRKLIGFRWTRRKSCESRSRKIPRTSGRHVHQRFWEISWSFCTRVCMGAT